jgi:hypothetical protein
LIASQKGNFLFWRGGGVADFSEKNVSRYSVDFADPIPLDFWASFDVIYGLKTALGMGFDPPPWVSGMGFKSYGFFVLSTLLTLKVRPKNRWVRRNYGLSRLWVIMTSTVVERRYTFIEETGLTPGVQELIRGSTEEDGDLHDVKDYVTQYLADVQPMIKQHCALGFQRLMTNVGLQICKFFVSFQLSLFFRNQHSLAAFTILTEKSQKKYTLTLWCIIFIPSHRSFITR